MRRRYSFLIITIILLVLIVTLECLKEEEIEQKELPVSLVKSFEYGDADTKIDINLLEINSNKKIAKMINKEIRDLFEDRASDYIENRDIFTGEYSLTTVYNLNKNLLSIKIQEVDSNIANTSGNIYSCIYDIKNDMEFDLSAMLDSYKLKYNKEIEKINSNIREKHDYIFIDYPYVYINDKENLEVIVRSIILNEDNSYLNNLEIYEIEKNEKENSDSDVSNENDTENEDLKS